MKIKFTSSDIKTCKTKRALFYPLSQGDGLYYNPSIIYHVNFWVRDDKNHWDLRLDPLGHRHGLGIKKEQFKAWIRDGSIIIVE